MLETYDNSENPYTCPVICDDNFTVNNLFMHVQLN